MKVETLASTRRHHHILILLNIMRLVIVGEFIFSMLAGEWVVFAVRRSILS